ncbi:S-layer homology domain-containing protein [Anaerotignum faecicola]
MKRKFALILSAVMAASSLPLTAYAANFKDINDVPWAGAETVINSVADKGLLSGYEDGTFRAKNNVTYCEAMQMVYNVLVKTGVAKSMDAVEAYAYMGTLDTYQVPKWAQMAVAYGLKNGIIDMQLVATKFAGGNTAATREDVALLFGNALGMYYDKEKDAAEAKKFADYWSISGERLVQIDLLKRLGVVSGDNYNNFNPKKNINRAEMAVMLNKTNSILTEGVEESGTITNITVNENKYYNFTVRMTQGGTENVMATLGQMPVYSGNTTQTVALSSLNKGDQVSLIRSGNSVIAMRVTKGSTAQSKYDMTGYVDSYKNDSLSFENENTGETVKYPIKSGAKIVVGGQTVTRTQLKTLLDDHYKEHAYAGIKTTIEREKKNGNYEDVTYIEELYITFTNEYTRVGEVKSFSTNSVNMKFIGSSSEGTYYFAANCEFYIGDTKSTAAALKKLADSGTVYVKVTVNADEKVSKVIMSEDTFDEGKKDTSRTYKVKSLNDKKLVVEENKETTTFTFGSTNPLDNITFYGYKNKDWENLGNVDKAEKFADDTDDTMYCKVVMNKSNKVTEIYLSTDKQAWNKTSDEKRERKGTVASIQNDVLKFKTSSVSYTMLDKYNTKDSDNTIKIGSTETQSKKLLTRLANDSAFELYAEIVADGNNKVTEVDARLTAATGKLVEYDQDKKRIKIETSGGEYELITTSKPKLTDEDDKKFTLDDIATSKYVGEEIKLGFNSSGVVNQFTLVNGPNVGSGLTKVSGIATSAANGLQVDGKSKAYSFLSERKMTLRVYGSPTESLDTVKKMIADPNVKVYVEAGLDDQERVETLNVYIREAAGELTSCDESYVRIKTASGNKFSFALPAKLKSCDVKGLNQKNLKDGDADNRGYHVKLTFGTDGVVSNIANS